MHTVKIKNIKRTLPENWPELTNDQAMKVVPYIFNPLLDKTDAKILALKALLSIKDKLFFKLNPVQVVQILSLIEFIFEEATPVPFIKEFEHKGIRYLAPAEKLSNISIVEFAMADAYFEAIDFETADINAYNRIIATLYRPEKENLNTKHPDYNGDPREKYNTILSEGRADHFSDLSPYIKISIIKFFLSCKKWISEEFSILFKKPKKDKDGKEIVVPVENKDIVPTWVGIIYDLGQQGIFGGFESVAYTNLHTVLIHLCREQQKAMDIENKNIFNK